jgi:hypothetical protein
MKCDTCDEQHLVAFSCKGRGFCPSCMGRRMAQTAANLTEYVLPKVALRQWVLTVPFELRARFGFDGKLLGAVSRLFVDSVLGWYRRRLRVSTREQVQSGAVVVVQRASSDLKLNPHLHVIFLDGVYTAAADGELVFRALPRLSTTDVADALQVARTRILGYLKRRGVVRIDGEALFIDDELAERDPALGQLARAAVSGLAPAGPELRRRAVELALRGRPGVVINAPLSVAEHGFTLHAATRAGAQDDKGREALLKYVLRPPIATESVLAAPDGLVRIAQKALPRWHRRARPRPALAAVPLSGHSTDDAIRMHLVRYFHPSTSRSRCRCIRSKGPSSSLCAFNASVSREVSVSLWRPPARVRAISCYPWSGRTAALRGQHRWWTARKYG